MKAKCHTGRGSIPIPTPTPIQTMIGLIGNHFLEETHEEAGLFGYPLATADSEFTERFFASTHPQQSEHPPKKEPLAI